MKNPPDMFTLAPSPSEAATPLPSSDQGHGEPVGPPEAPPVEQTTTVAQGTSWGPLGRCHRLLLVTADEGLRRAFEDAFGNALRFTAATSAEEAAGHLAARFYSHVLTDYDLPGRDGACLLHHVRGLAHGSIVFRMLISARAVPYLSDLTAEGILHVFMVKPFDPDEVAAYL